jgi:hypothetical protein
MGWEMLAQYAQVKARCGAATAQALYEPSGFKELCE